MFRVKLTGVPMRTNESVVSALAIDADTIRKTETS